MAWPRRIAAILTAFFAGNFLAVNVLLAGKVLVDFENLHYYSKWEYFGGPFVGYLLQVLIGTVGNCVIVSIPTLLFLIFTETLRIRSVWFYAVTAGLAAFLFDIACTKFDLIEARSFCVAFSFSEAVIVTTAGATAGFVFWRIAGIRSGEWRSRMALNTSASV